MIALIADETLNQIVPKGLPFTAATSGTGTESLVSAAVGFLTVVSGLAFILYFIIAGFSWITAGGDPEKLKKAQTNITNALVGIVIVAIAYTVTAIIGSILGFDILNPAQVIEKISPQSESPSYVVPPRTINGIDTR
jgi:hypothetical protein